MQTIWRCVFLAFGYFLLALIARSLALPPGYASPVWPASGLAVGGLLLWGISCWRGIFLGAFTYNLLAGYLATSSLTITASLLVACATSLQAIIAALLTRQFLHAATPLARQRDALYFLILAGPLACTVSSTLSIGSLFVLGQLPLDGIFSQWLAWWSGDTIGVLLFAPLVFTISPNVREIRAINPWQFVLPLLLIIIMVVGSLIWLNHSPSSLPPGLNVNVHVLNIIAVIITFILMFNALASAGRIVAITHEIKQRKAAQDKLRENERFLNEAEQLARVSGWRIDLDTMKLVATPQMNRLLDLPEDKELTLEESISYLTPDSQEKLKNAIERAMIDGTPYDMDLASTTATGRSVWGHVYGRAEFENGKVVRLYGATQDITPRRQMEQQNNHAQRLQAIGTLAGGIAHDLNNTLTPILLLMDILKEDYPDKIENLKLIEKSSLHAADMVRQLLTFAKGSEIKYKLIQPHILISELENLIQGTFPKNLKTHFEYDNNLPSIQGDMTQLHQVLLNLCVNARDAMPHGGTLSLNAFAEMLTEPSGTFVLDAKPGNYLVLRVSDTGSGIAPEILDRIFDPFFTTKGPEKGAGLGLSTVLGIIRSHNGFLKIDSTLGAGTIFTIYLPVAKNERKTSDQNSVAQPLHHQGEKILFIDDEVSVRELASLMLSKLGYVPVIAESGAEALELAATQNNEWRLIITDLHMPEMDGLELVKKIRGILPTIPIIVASGFLDDDTAEQFKQLGVTLRMDKPFARQSLQTIIDVALHHST